MASSINASTAGAGGVITTADSSGILNLQSGGVTQATISSSGLSLPNAATINTANTFGFKNRLINGNMIIDQRYGGASVTASSTGNLIYTIDRWAYYADAASKFSVQQSTTAPTGFSNSALITSLSAYSVTTSQAFGIQQTIEAFNTTDLNLGTANAKTFTLSFWVRSSLTGAFGGSVRNPINDYTYPFSYTISAANTWEQKTIVVSPPTTGTWAGATNGAGLRVWFSLGAGSGLTGPANTWAATNYLQATGSQSLVGTSGATLYITGVQLEVGSQATSFDFRAYSAELQLCQRYFENVSARYGGPAQSSAAASGTGIFVVEKRATPTIAWVSTTSVLNFPTGAPLGYSPVINTRYFTPFKAASSTGYDSRFDDLYTASAEL